MTAYVVEFARDETGRWLAAIPAVQGCHTHGRTIEQVRERIREALGLWVDDADDAVLEERIKLPRRAKTSLAAWRRAKANAESAQRRAQMTAEVAARDLTSWRLSYRDVGELMGLSRQRAQQITARTRRRGWRNKPK